MLGMSHHFNLKCWGYLIISTQGLGDHKIIPNVGPMVIGDEVQEYQLLLQDHVGYFAFNLKELGQLRR
jgi:hypothetical protein